MESTTLQIHLKIVTKMQPRRETMLITPIHQIGFVRTFGMTMIRLVTILVLTSARNKV
jgi:hypothetical protein